MTEFFLFPGYVIPSVRSIDGAFSASSLDFVLALPCMAGPFDPWTSRSAA